MRKLLMIPVILGLIALAVVTFEAVDHPAPVVASTTTGDIALADAMKRAHDADPHAVQVLDKKFSTAEADSLEIPFSPSLEHTSAQIRVIGFKGDFVESGFPGTDGKTHHPFAFFIYQPDGRLTGWSFADQTQARKWGVQ